MESQATPHDDLLVFRDDRRKLLLGVLVSVVCVAVGLWFIAHPQSGNTAKYSLSVVAGAGSVTAAFGSLGVVVFAVSLARPTMVALRPDALTISTALKTYSRSWNAVGDFKIWTYRSNDVVVFNDSNPPNTRLANLNLRLIGATSAMPTTLNVGSEQLLAALLSAKARWG